MDIEQMRNTLRQIIDGRASRALAIAERGSSTIQFPGELADLVDETFEGLSAFEAIDPAHHGQAVAAFQLARRTGSATVRSVDDRGATVDLHFVDATDQFGCVIALFVPASKLVSDDVEPITVLSRRFTWTWAPVGQVLTVDDNLCRRLGWKPEDIVGGPSLWLVHPDDRESTITGWGELLDSPGAMLRSRKRFATSNGGWVWGEATAHNRLQDPDHRDVLVEVLDISEEMAALEALREREELLATLTEALPAGVMHLDSDGNVRFSNTRWHELVGLSPEASIDELCDLVVEPADIRECVVEAVRSATDCDIEVRFRPRPASDVEFGALRVRPLEGQTSGRRSVLLVLDDATAERHHRARLNDAAISDPLTGVLNRAGLEARLGAMLDRREPVTVLFCDLDGLKQINDARGHSAGDEAIIELSSALTHVVRAGDLVGRLGGDEFVVALVTDDQQFVESVVEEISERLLLASPADGALPLRCSIGVAAREDGDDVHVLLGRADTQMYRIKELRRRTSA